MIIELHSTTAGQGLPWLPRLPPNRSASCGQQSGMSSPGGLGLGEREESTQSFGLGLCLDGKAGEKSEGESERSQSATAGIRVLARPSWGRLSSSQSAAGQRM